MTIYLGHVYIAALLRFLDQPAPTDLPLGSSLQASPPGLRWKLSSSVMLLPAPLFFSTWTEASSCGPSELWTLSCLWTFFLLSSAYFMPFPPVLLPPPALDCPPNSKYTICAKPCPNTCHSKFFGMSCKGRCVEGCECNPGFILSGLQCVPQSQCGCLDSTGRYIMVSRWGWAS